MSANVGVFLLAIWGHLSTLVAGCVVTFLIGLIEKHILKRPISVKAEIMIFLCFIFFACFQAWQDAYTSQKGLQAQINGKSQQPTIQVNVPPTQVVVTPQPPSAVPLAPQHSHVGFAPPAMPADATDRWPPFHAGQIVAVDVAFLNVGDYTVRDQISGEIGR